MTAKPITREQVIDHKIDRVFMYDLPRVGKYQPRKIYVELDSGISFDFAQYPQSEPLSGHSLIALGSLPPTVSLIVDRASEFRLDGSIRSVIGSNDWEASFGLLLENGNVLFQGCNEQEDFLVFSTLKEASVDNYYELVLPTVEG